jgi:hypothetical protein
MRSRLFPFFLLVLAAGVVAGTLFIASSRWTGGHHSSSSQPRSRYAPAPLSSAVARSAGVDVDSRAMAEVIDRKKAAWNWVRDHVGL